MKHPKTTLRRLTAAVSACFAASAFALPTGPVVVNGAASLNQAGNVLSVTNSNGAILNWQKFGIAANEAVRFNQSSASSSVLNRVVGADPSQIYGQLTSNGRVWLINPAGILVGPGGRIDTAGFVASTLNVSNQDFLAGRLNFQAAAGAGSVVNQGSITTPEGGTVYLVGANVSNEGLITTPNGETILAAGQTVNLIDTATPGVTVEITGATGNVTNLGEIAATAGRIGMAGVLVKNSGILNASSVISEGGRIFLRASRSIEIDAAGRIVADGTKGGNITAITQDGGQIAGTLVAHGTISAQGDGSKGSGGFVETSAAKVDLSGLVVKTHGGEWLIDPAGFVIGTDITGAALAGELEDGDIAITSSNILVNDNVPVDYHASTNSTTDSTLTLNATSLITVNAPITASNGKLSVALNAAGGTVTVTSIGSVATNGGNIAIQATNVDLQGALNAGTGAVALTAPGDICLGTALSCGINLSNAELANIAANTLTFYGAGATVNGVDASSGAGIGQVVINTTSNGIFFGTTKSTFKALTANAYSSLSIDGDIETTAGDLVLRNALDGGNLTGDDDFHFAASGSQTLTSAGNIVIGNSANVIKGGATVNLSATNDISFNITSAYSNTFTGNWTVAAGGSISATNGAIGGNTISLTSVGDMNLSSGVDATGAVALNATNGSVTLGGSLSAANTMSVTAGNDITFLKGASLRATSAALEVDLTSNSGAIVFGDGTTGIIDINNVSSPTANLYDLTLKLNTAGGINTQNGTTLNLGMDSDANGGYYGNVMVNVLNGKTWTNNGTVVLQGPATYIDLTGGAVFDNRGTLTLNTWVGGFSGTDAAAIQGSDGTLANSGIVDVQYGASIDALYNQTSSGTLKATDFNINGNAQSITLNNAGDIAGAIDMSLSSNSDASRYPTFTIAGGTNARIHDATITLDGNDIYVTGSNTVAFENVTIQGYDDPLAGYQSGNINVGQYTNGPGNASATFSGVTAKDSILNYGWYNDGNGGNQGGNVSILGNSIFKSISNTDQNGDPGTGTLTLNNAILGLTDAADFTVPTSVTYTGNVGYVVAQNLIVPSDASIVASGNVTLLAGWDKATGWVTDNAKTPNIDGGRGSGYNVTLSGPVVAGGDLTVLASAGITLNSVTPPDSNTYTIAHAMAGATSADCQPNATSGLCFTSTYGSGFRAGGNLKLLAEGAIDIGNDVGVGGNALVVAGWDFNSGATSPATIAYNHYASQGALGLRLNGATLFSWNNGNVTMAAAGKIRIDSKAGQAGIDMGAGALTVAAESLELSADNVGTPYYTQAYMARIVSNGDQTFALGDQYNPGALLLHGNNVQGSNFNGDGVTTTDGFFGGSASIERYGYLGGGVFHTTTGGQKFTIYGSGSVTLTAGNGDGAIAPGVWSGDCAVGGCSDNYAKIEDHGGGGQTFDFVDGGSLTLKGGASGTDNYARISSDGAQKIWSSGGNAFDITITGGTGGGNVAGSYFTNDASIISTTSQDINTYGGALTMFGGGDAATYGGAFLMAPTQNLSFGDVVLTGGYSNAVGDEGVGTPVVIGYKSAANVTLNVAGSLNIVGGYGYSYGSFFGTTSPVLIGSLHGSAAVSITTTGNVSITSGNSGVGIGSLSPLALADGDLLGSVYIASGASITAAGTSAGSAKSRIQIDADGDVYINGTVKSEGSYELTPQANDYQYDSAGSDGIFITAGKGTFGGNVVLGANSTITGDQVFLTALSNGYSSIGNIEQFAGGSIRITGGGGNGGYSNFVADGALSIASIFAPSGVIKVSAYSVYGYAGSAASPNIVAGVLDINAANGIGGVNGLVTAVDRINSLSAANGDINIQNYGALIVGPASVSDPLNSVCSNPAVSVCSGGAVVVATHSPLTVNGAIAATGSVSLAAGGGGTLTVAAGVPVSGSSIALAAGTFVVSPDSFSVAPTQTNNTPASGGGGASTPPPPTLDTCVANPALSGCSSVLPTLATCTTNPTAAGCSVVLPPVTNCTTNPTAAGCSPVTPQPPTLAICTANPTVAGCAAILPTLATCTTNPTASGCSAVLPPLATCATTPTLAGCSSVLPTLAACTTNPTAAGCSTVLPPLATCATTPTLAGCSAVLPTLASCSTNPTQEGCTAVLPPTDTSKQTDIVKTILSLTNTHTVTPPIVIPPPPTGGATLTSMQNNGTIGGGEGSFGGTSFSGGGGMSGGSLSGGSGGSGGSPSGGGGAGAGDEGDRPGSGKSASSDKKDDKDSSQSPKRDDGNKPVRKPAQCS